MSEPVRDRSGARVEELRAAFHARLRSDAARLTHLGACTAALEGEAQTPLDEIIFLAHRMRGAAYAFGYEDLGDAAGDLEELARGAVKQAGDTAAPQHVRDAIVALVMRVRETASS